MDIVGRLYRFGKWGFFFGWGGEMGSGFCFWGKIIVGWLD